jgi:hypothetical protein
MAVGTTYVGGAQDVTKKFILTINWVTSSIGSGNGLNMYLSPGTWVRFPRKTKTIIKKGVEEDRGVAAGTTYVGGAWAVTISELIMIFKLS